MAIQLENSDLQAIKTFPVLKDYLNQFDWCIYKKRDMKGNYKLIPAGDIIWNADCKLLLRFESYFRQCCSLIVENNILIIGEYAFKLKQQ